MKFFHITKIKGYKYSKWDEMPSFSDLDVQKEV